MKSGWQQLRRELKSESDLETALIPILAKLAPRCEFDELPWNADAERLRWWLFENLDASTPSEHTDQYWFKITASYWGERIDSCDLELAGGEESDRFDVPLERVTWEPPNSQLGSSVLPCLARSESPHPQELCVAYSALAVQQAFRGIDEQLLLGRADSRGVTVGFEDGPGVHLGRFDGEHWDRDELCSY